MCLQENEQWGMSEKMREIVWQKGDYKYRSLSFMEYNESDRDVLAASFQSWMPFDIFDLVLQACFYIFSIHRYLAINCEITVVYSAIILQRLTVEKMIG